MASRAKAKGAGDGADSGGEKSPPQEATPSQTDQLLQQVLMELREVKISQTEMRAYN